MSKWDLPRESLDRLLALWVDRAPGGRYYWHPDLPAPNRMKIGLAVIDWSAIPDDRARDVFDAYCSQFSQLDWEHAFNMGGLMFIVVLEKGEQKV